MIKTGRWALRPAATWLLVSALGACTTVTEQPKEQPKPPAEKEPVKVERPAAPPAPVSPAGNYSVDPSASRLLILVYRTGKLERLGHNHVLAAQDLKGEVRRGERLVGSSVELTVPVDALVVDNEELRRTLGPDFEGQPQPTDVEAVRQTLLSDRVLDAKKHPEVRLQGRITQAAPPRYTLEGRLSLRGVERPISVPLQVDDTRERIVAAGELSLLQSEFGIKPLSMLAGALRVEDKLTVRFEVVARRE